MWMLVLGLLWGLLALGVALVLGRTIRRADERTSDGAWQAFCSAHGLEEPAWQDDQVGA
jgi:hypothetical protein